MTTRVGEGGDAAVCHYWRKETGGGETATRINTWSRTYVRTDGRLKATAANSIKRTDGRASSERDNRPPCQPIATHPTHTHTHTHVVCGPGGPSFHRRTFSLSVYNTETTRAYIVRRRRATSLRRSIRHRASVRPSVKHAGVSVFIPRSSFFEPIRQTSPFLSTSLPQYSPRDLPKQV